MNSLYLFKSIPFLTTLIIILFLNITNQKEYTKLRILIWNTPELSLGTYLAISSGSGFILSYLISNKIIKTIQPKSRISHKYKFNNQSDQSSEYNETNETESYENIFIERDVNDPSPTIKANFRVIGKVNKRQKDFDYIEENEDINTDLPDDSVDQSNYNKIKHENETNIKSITNDWYEDNFSNW